MAEPMIPTTDLCDAHEDQIAAGTVRVLPPLFQSFGRRAAFCGPVATLRVAGDNALLRAALSAEGRGRVLVVDGGGTRRCALLGGNMAALAAKNGWSGVVINGCVRDGDEIDGCDVAVRALALHPVRSAKRGSGEADVAVEIGGVWVNPGEWCYGDRDGIVVSAVQLGKA